MDVPASAEDEFDALPDPFEGVDFDQIPELCGTTAGHVDSDYDEFFDDLDPLALDLVPDLGPVLPTPGPGPGRGPQNSQQPRAHPSAPVMIAENRVAPPTHTQADELSAPTSQVQASAASTQYPFDEIDGTFLQEVTVLEQEANGQAHTGNTRSQAVAQNVVNGRDQLPSVALSNRTTQRSSFKRKRSDVSSAPVTPSKRNKFSRTKSKEAPVDPHASARKVLDGMEEELTCPICYDLLAVTHSTTPCGHSYCGDCLLKWLEASRKPPPDHALQCPVCRTKLSSSDPLTPNVAMDNVVQRYVSSAAEVGKVDWQPHGERYQAFLTRKAQSATLAHRLVELQNPPPPAAQGWVDDDPDWPLSARSSDSISDDSDDE